ncbi:MAG: DNA recombination protein RmuC [Candidatus Neomarinimicrobiota bacterium]|nr:DNA recombination protein RmuC [Candidatus Neomarinimicrobiota bacterium]MDX9779839.1 DNA recombination protein RmuC [bacterium]
MTRNMELNRELAEKSAQLIRVETENGLLKQNAEQSEQLQKALSERFENLANRIFDEKDRKSTDKIKMVLEPIGKDLEQFRKKVEELNSGTADRMTVLSTKIEDLQKLNQTITEETSNLTRALKGDVKKQGNWGELILSRLLEMSGLRKGIEYETQFSVSEEGGRLQPDVLIKLPEGKHLIIDSKVSFIDYNKYLHTDDETEMQQYRKALMLSMKRHVDGLHEKHYQNLKNVFSPDYVFMFIPVEGVFATVMENDMSLYQYAIKKNVIIIGPSSLLASLRTVSFIWQQENQAKNALDIALKSGALYDKFVAFYEDIEKIGKQLDITRRTYDAAVNKLSSGRGNLISRANEIRDMGARASKKLPSSE